MSYSQQFFSPDVGLSQVKLYTNDVESISLVEVKVGDNVYQQYWPELLKLYAQNGVVDLS